jgi:hypothetical protein
MNISASPDVQSKFHESNQRTAQGLPDHSGTGMTGKINITAR